jgi:hypothetical protein
MFRALAGIWFVLGLMLAYVIPSIEKRSAWFALICLAIFGMGVGRFLSFVHFSPAPGNSLGAMVAELVLPPILVLWQRSVARASASQVPYPWPPNKALQLTVKGRARTASVASGVEQWRFGSASAAALAGS